MCDGLCALLPRIEQRAYTVCLLLAKHTKTSPVPVSIARLPPRTLHQQTRCLRGQQNCLPKSLPYRWAQRRCFDPRYLQTARLPFRNLLLRPDTTELVQSWLSKVWRNNYSRMAPTFPTWGLQAGKALPHRYFQGRPKGNKRNASCMQTVQW